MALRDRNARQVRRLLEAEPEKLSKGSPGYDTQFAHRERGTSRPPIPDHAHRFIDDGLTFAEVGKNEPIPRSRTLAYRSVLNAALSTWKARSHPNGVSYASVLGMLWTEPGSSRWMREGASETAKAYEQAFDTLCRLVAGEFEQIYPGVEIHVQLDEADSPVATKLESHHRDRTLTAHDSYRRIYQKLLEIEATGIRREEAKKKLACELDCSYWRVQDAIRHATSEDGPAA